jgi:hypothetical protein
MFIATCWVQTTSKVLVRERKVKRNALRQHRRYPAVLVSEIDAGDSTPEFASDAARWSSDAATDIKNLLRCIETLSAGELECRLAVAEFQSRSSKPSGFLMSFVPMA